AGAYLQQSVVWAVRGPPGAIFDEDAPPVGDPILASALDSERIAREAGAKHGFRTAILRCGGFYSADGWHTRILAESLFRGRRAPRSVARLFWGRYAADLLAASFPTSNARFRSDFRWTASFPTFVKGLGEVVAAWRSEGFPGRQVPRA